MAEHRSDEDLVAACRSDAGSADFEELVARHRVAVLRLVLSVLGHDFQADAEDVVQLVFLRAHDRLGTFRGSSRFGTWLHRIARNLALDHARTLRRRRRLLDEDERGASAGRAEPAPGGSEPGMAEDVRRALEGIPNPLRTALRLHYWLDQSVAEIAEAMGVREGTAKSYLHRGRRRLARLLTEKERLP